MPTRTWSSACSTATSTTTPTSRSSTSLRIRTDHDRRQGDPVRWWLATPAPVRRAPIEAFRRTVAAFEGSVAIGRARRRGSRPHATRAARQRPGALRRVRRGRASSSPANRTVSSKRPRSIYAWMARRRHSRTPTVEVRSSSSTPSAGIDRRHHAAVAYDGTLLPVDCGRAGDAPSNHPRHRPRRLPSLPAQGDHRVAVVVPQDAARQIAPTGGRLAAASAPDDLGRAEDRLAAEIRRIVVIGPGDRRRRRRRALAIESELGDRLVGARPSAGDRALRLRNAARHDRHAGRGDQPVGTTTDTNRTVDLAHGPRRDRDPRSSTGATAT